VLWFLARPCEMGQRTDQSMAQLVNVDTEPKRPIVWLQFIAVTVSAGPACDPI
jgi:hypothetical protein